MKCKLCSSETKLVKAHVIPKSFCKQVSEDPTTAKLVTNTPGEYPKRNPVGVYDPTLVCADCENLFAPWDDYAFSVLVRDENLHVPIKDGERTIGYTIAEVDYRKLKLFAISVLWRASASSHGFFHRVKTGPHETQLASMIRAGTPGEPEDFAAVFAKFDGPFETFQLDPHFERYDGINFYRIYLSRYVISVKVDHRPPPALFDIFVLRPDRPLCIALRNLRRSSELSLLRTLAASANW